MTRRPESRVWPGDPDSPSIRKKRCRRETPAGRRLSASLAFSTMTISIAVKK